MEKPSKNVSCTAGKKVCVQLYKTVNGKYWCGKHSVELGKTEDGAPLKHGQCK